MAFVLILSFLGRVFLARNRRKFEGGRGTGSVVLGRYLGRMIEPMRRRSSRRDRLSLISQMNRS